MRKSHLFLLAAPLLFLGAGCSRTTQPTGPLADVVPVRPVVSVDEEGYTNFDATSLRAELDGYESAGLSDMERQGLVYMREEEKLAHDLYAALYDIWGQNAFGNISSSELTHTSAVRELLDKYSVEDPAVGTLPGEFADVSLQELYDSLLVQGSESLIEALKVGAIVEEVDILDLKKYLEEVDNDDIILVYENLMRGSRNHLRAFVRSLSRQGIDYEPQYLSDEEYREIVGGDMERGGGGFGMGR